MIVVALPLAAIDADAGTALLLLLLEPLLPATVDCPLEADFEEAPLSLAQLNLSPQLLPFLDLAPVEDEVAAAALGFDCC